MLNSLKYALLAGVIFTLTPQALAETPKDTLVIAENIDDMISLDPAEAYELSGIQVLANTYDRIMRFEPTDINTLVGGVAESVTPSDDGKSFTFKIRSGLTFASGNPVTAKDAAFSLQRVIKLNKTPVFLLSQLGWTPENIDQMVTAPDDATLVVKIGVDFAPSLVYALLSSVVGSVVDQKVAMEHEKAGDFGYEWLKTNSAGSGAFTLKSWKPNESVTLEANPTYRGGAPAMKRVVIRHVPEPAAQRLLIEKGDTDVALNMTGDQITGVKGNPDIVVTASPQALLYYVGMCVCVRHFATSSTMMALSIPSCRAAPRFINPSGPQVSGLPLMTIPISSTQKRRRHSSGKPVILTDSRLILTRQIPRPLPISHSRFRQPWRRVA
jgi:peptide/nickel transport system substrate-binding protein